MNDPIAIRDYIVERLHRDLVGPMDLKAPVEILSDYPTDKYLTGILYPRQSAIPDEEDDEMAAGSEDESEASTEEAAVSLSRCIRPASAGLSFSIHRVQGSGPIEVVVSVSAAKYLKRWLAEDGKTLSDRPRQGKMHVRWQRHQPPVAPIPLSLDFTEPKSIPLAPHGLDGLELYVQLAHVRAELAATVVLINQYTTSREERDTNEEKTWFQTSIRVEPGKGCELKGRSIRKAGSSRDDQTAELIYRDVLEYAVGHTCSASWETDQEGRVPEVRTNWIPHRIVEAVSAEGDAVFKTIRGNPTLSPFSASWLAEAPKNDLLQALSLLPDAYERWMTQEVAKMNSLPAKLKSYAQAHEKLWKDGANRMLGAIQRLENNPAALRAFQLANKAMALQRKWACDEDDLLWRPFQLAFQLLVLESVLDRNHADRNVMDLLWFPTGGGKTEAYLAVIASLLFYRRLATEEASDGAGVCVLMRYTLRVLTTQQFERAAVLMCACEYLRGTEHLKGGEESFSVGLWVGGKAIPNRVDEARADSEQRAFQVKDCPRCRTRLSLGSNPTTYEIYCPNKDCYFGQRNRPMPIWTVDEDVYRVLPSLLIGTIDKFAQIARNPETGRLFGIGTPHLPPELIIQDELHLISGPLGTLAGLYETAIDAFCSRNNRPAKVIGSTATIKMADLQVKDLFNRRVYQFPPPGIDAANSCFAVRDISKPGRLYLGVTTAGRSAKFTLQALCASLMQSADSPAIPPSRRDDYWTLVTYFNSLRELGGAHVLMLDDVPKTISEYARRRSEASRDILAPAELTSRLSQAEIPDVLKKMQEAQQSGQAEDALLCTNMISVGVDIPRLALMVVNGQPKAISEYIQATSRVGRDIVSGLIVTVFNNGKPRDRSRYETFSTWHGTLYRDVEPTSVTPFAARALDKALRAVLVSLVRHSLSTMKTKPVLDAAKRAQVQQLADVIIQRAGAVDPPERSEVERKLDIILDEWEKREGVKHYWNEYKPQETLMMSAETIAARKAANRPESSVWSAPNSMRDVEPGTHFRLLE